MNPHSTFCNTRHYARVNFGALGGICDCHVSAFFDDEPLAPWERELLGTRAHTEGYGDVTFHRTDGLTVVIKNLRVDGIGIDHNTQGLGVISATDEDDKIYHIPFVSHWTVEYRF